MMRRKNSNQIEGSLHNLLNNRSILSIINKSGLYKKFRLLTIKLTKAIKKKVWFNVQIAEEDFYKRLI